MSRRRARQKSDQALRSIGEAAQELGVETHTIRYWQDRFPEQVQPLRRGDGRRYFRPEDMTALRAISLLVRKQGMTLKGAGRILSDSSPQAVIATASGNAAHAMQALISIGMKAPAETPQQTVAPSADIVSETRLAKALSRLTNIKAELDGRDGQERGRLAA